MKNFLYILSITTLLISCRKEQEPKSKVSYDKKIKTEVAQDTSSTIISENPVYFDGLNVLIFPIGEIKGYTNKRGEYVSSSNYENNSDFSVSNTIEDELSGYLTAVKFQNIGQDSLRNLTEKKVLIERMTLVKPRKNFVYVLADDDTNQDNKIDSDDIKSLYISESDGKDFVKISSELQELIDWKYLPVNDRIYFRTIDDANKNGKFDQKDGLHYFYYSFREKKPVEYKPL